MMHTVSTYEVNGGWVVAENEVWLPGTYATDAVARRAVQFRTRDLMSLERIWVHDGENRPVTDADLDALVR